MKNQKKIYCVIENKTLFLHELYEKKMISGDFDKICKKPLFAKWDRQGVIENTKEYAKKHEIPFIEEPNSNWKGIGLILGSNEKNIPAAEIGFKIDWDLGLILCFTDGSCVKNGQKNAKAGWAFKAENVEKHGPLPAFEVYYDNGFKETKKIIRPTNNRAELYAIAKCLEFAFQNGFLVRLVTDSKYCQNLIFSLMPSKSTKLNYKQNLDIIGIIEKFIGQVIDCIWQKAHVLDKEKYNLVYEDNNKIVDILAQGKKIVDELAKLCTIENSN